MIIMSPLLVLLCSETMTDERLQTLKRSRVETGFKQSEKK